MSLIDMSQFDRVRVGDNPPRPFLRPDPEGHRVGGGSEPGESVVTVRSYADGFLVVGVAGPVDRATAGRIGALLRDLRPHSTGGLVITLSRLEEWDPHLARVLGRAHVHRLIDGAVLELQDAPSDLVSALGIGPAPPERTR